MFTISFNFNPDTAEITNMQVKKIEVQKDEAIVVLEDNKLKFSKSALELLNAKSGDRIQVNYYTVNEEETFPVIGKSEVFTDSEGGSKLTKSRTVSYRGQQKEILQLYGNFFKLESFKNYFKMIPITPITENDDLKEEKEDLENI